eukprot:10068075-Ditylum_brightwellii.AAC.1
MSNNYYNTRQENLIDKVAVGSGGSFVEEEVLMRSGGGFVEENIVMRSGCSSVDKNLSWEVM